MWHEELADYCNWMTNVIVLVYPYHAEATVIVAGGERRVGVALSDSGRLLS